MALFKRFVKMEHIDICSGGSRTTWIIYVVVFVSRVPNRRVIGEISDAPTLCADVVHVPTTPDALQGPPN